ncbi:MAG: hypothetical protein H7321_10055 [Bacteroidia bacterium]|nr:hypothetical protein [Bacteroidia bacterium]
MKKIFLIFVFALGSQFLSACPVCEKQQPKITLGLTHGAGPQSNWDWVIIAVVAIITLLTFVFSAKYLFKPGEHNADHIKQSIFNN